MQGTQPCCPHPELLEGAAGADKTPVKEIVWSQAGSRAMLGAGVQTNSQNSKSAFSVESKKDFFFFSPSLALSLCLN